MDHFRGEWENVSTSLGHTSMDQEDRWLMDMDARRRMQTWTAEDQAYGLDNLSIPQHESSQARLRFKNYHQRALFNTGWPSAATRSFSFLLIEVIAGLHNIPVQIGLYQEKFTSYQQLQV